VEFQQLQLHRIQFRWDADTYSDAVWNSDSDTFERVSVSFSRTEQHSNWRRGDVHYFNGESGIHYPHGDLRSGRHGRNRLELLAQWNAWSGHDPTRHELSYDNTDGVERG